MTNLFFIIFSVCQSEITKTREKSPLDMNLTKVGYISLKVHFQKCIHF